MPEQDKPIDPAFPNPAEHNAEVKITLESQGAPTVGSDVSDLQASSDALDALAATIEKKVDDVLPEVTPAAPAAPAAPAPTAEELAAKEAAAAAAARSEEIFKGSPTLPPGASPKSAEAFSAVKIRAAQEISARDAQLEETRKKLAEAEERLKAGPDPAVVKELEEHRQWRARLDVDADPKFKEFDKQIAASHEFIYAQLRKSPAVTAEVIEQIKKLGGPENVNLDKIFSAVKDSTLQRVVEAKVADIEVAKFNKDQAVAEAKKNIAGYLEQQRKSYEESVGSHNAATKARFSELSSKLSWFSEKPVDAKADEPTRKSAEAHNTFIKGVRSQLDEALRDDTPEMRAIMLAGMAQLIYLQRVHEGTKAESAALKAELAEAKTKLEKLTGASVSRLRETGARPGGAIPKAPAHNWDARSGDALDDIAKQISEERARKASA